MPFMYRRLSGNRPNFNQSLRPNLVPKWQAWGLLLRQLCSTARVCWRTLHQTLCFVWQQASWRCAGDVRGLPLSDSPWLNGKSSVMVLVLWGKDIRTREEGPVSAQQKRTEIPGASIVLSMGRGSCVRAAVQACLSQLRPWHCTARTRQRAPHTPLSSQGRPLAPDWEHCALGTNGHGFLLGTLLCNGSRRQAALRQAAVRMPQSVQTLGGRWRVCQVLSPQASSHSVLLVTPCAAVNL